MPESSIVTIEADSVRNFSPGDGDGFFAWLEGLSAVTRCVGRLSTLYIDVDVDT